jgi:hypothetical protein
MGIGTFFVLRWINKFFFGNKKEQKKIKAANNKLTEKEAASRSAQEELGLADIVGHDIIMADGTIINLFAVHCINVSLMTVREKVQEAQRTSRVLSTLKEGFTLLKFHRAADNTQQIKQLKVAKKEVEKRLNSLASETKTTKAKEHERQFLLARHGVLSEKLAYELAQEQNNEQRFVSETYICLKTKPGKNSQRTALEEARRLLSRLAANGYNATRLTDMAVIDVVKAYFDEPSAPKINLQPERQIPYLAPEIRHEVTSALEDRGEVESPPEVLEEAIRTEQDTDELLAILVELEDLNLDERVMVHVA